MSDQDDGDWAERAKQHGVNPQEVMQRAAAQMQRESAAARIAQEHAEPAPVPEIWLVLEQKAHNRWKATSVGTIGGRTVEAYGNTEQGAAGPQFRYQLAHALQSETADLAWDDARALALRYRVNVAEVRRLRE